MQMVFVRPEMLLLDKILKFPSFWARFVPLPASGPRSVAEQRTGQGPSVAVAECEATGPASRRPLAWLRVSWCSEVVSDGECPAGTWHTQVINIISGHVCRLRGARVKAWRDRGDRGNHAVYHRQGELHQQQLRGGWPPLQRGEADYWEGEARL